MKIAFVYDRVNKWGGAERVLLALHKIWPAAPLFTAVYDPGRAGWAHVFNVHPSFLQRVPFAKNHHEWFPWATPMAFESFDFSGYDVVLSVASAEAKSIITKPGTMHVCYCLTPTRYLWSAQKDYEGLGLAGKVLRMFAPTLRKWDEVAASRPDYYIAISDTVKNRIKQYYHRDVAGVIYPPVDGEKFRADKSDGYFLCVARLVGYKRVDLIIDAFNQLGWPLVVVGEGRDKSRLMRRAGKNIRFEGIVSDEALINLYARCHAFVYAGEEDFGLAAVEAQACGKPIVAYGRGGIAEIVKPGKTGELFEEQTVDSFVHALKTVQRRWYDSALCQKNAERFSRARFAREMKEAVTRLYNKKTV